MTADDLGIDGYTWAHIWPWNRGVPCMTPDGRGVITEVVWNGPVRRLLPGNIPDAQIKVKVGSDVRVYDTAVLSELGEE